MIEVETKKNTGSFYTKPEIVSLMLDIIGYNIDEKLFQKKLLEPSAGEGAFLIPVIRRLVKSMKTKLDKVLFDDDEYIFRLAKDSIYAIEIDEVTYQNLYLKVKETLMQEGLSYALSERLADNWIIQEDYLLWNKPVSIKFDFIIGNPPYVRIENWNRTDSKNYRRLYPTLYDRADIYIAFIEHGLEMLSSDGKLTFICTDRFTKNRYGKKIRNLINENFHVVNYLDIHNSQPFVDKVSAYPCIFTIRNGSKTVTRTLKMDGISLDQLKYAREYLLEGKDITECQDIHSISTHTLSTWFNSNGPWVLNGARAKEILEKIEISNPLITDYPHNVEIGIGVATGAKNIYIIRPEEVDVEKDILLPVVTKDDIKKGFVESSGRYLINPYQEDGSLINLELYPKLKKYLYKHEEELKSRNTAKKNPKKWYKTIDRIFPERLYKRKILIPDIKSNQLMVLESGQYYPEHSLYYMTAGKWDIKVLQALLLSSVVKFFIWSYATKMRGDYLRYQAQYLKKIRLPICLSMEDKELLKKYYKEGDIENIDLIAQKVYKLTSKELIDIKDLVDS